jgi:hypothetical protein
MGTQHTPHPEVVFRRLEDRLVLVHLGTNQVFELNETGARVWELLAEGLGDERIAAVLAAEFEVEAERARSELAALLDELVAQRLIS